ncbi:uncharacterized protein K452DRAFT_254814 [Aplosporella prunicola CBS 121167]|uniref:Uncharacterized protein n=1 Tax=Aplosporella prunicola CBS 121167 TaxID=1176127 RepID=A0A6A6B6Z6_9PEZI|nr:uncharacterized protein K452DRAFT_254814 [Aplosporella prunicola CBS 121167]KAF2139418.1 hypothetical protein K452DRAFT_254814 [Aplosporella prunicola CBS 121167]
MNGYRPTSSGLGSGTSANGAYAGASSNPPRTMPHISDLKARAESRLQQAPPSVGPLLQMAEQSTKQIDTLLDLRRPDFAYIEYLVASEIVFNRVPYHKDAPIFKGDRASQYNLHKSMAKHLSEKADRFASIKEIIINDNKRSGVQPTVTVKGSSDGHARFASMSAAAPAKVPIPTNPRYSMKDELFLDNGTNGSGSSPRMSIDASSSLSGRSTPFRADSPRPRSDIQRKPVPGPPSGLSSQGDALSERFARLRVAGESRSRQGSVQMPSPEDFNGMVPGPGKLLGPREMRPGAFTPPAHPPKLPLNTQIPPSMLKEPSPTYSPARNMATPASINPPRSTPRSMVRQNSFPASGMSPQTTGSNGDPDPSVSQHASQPPRVIRRKSVHAPREFQISAEKLYDYLKPYNVLLIDVRNREEFDDGHVFVNSIMCIEPTALRPEMSAEQLQEALVLSPDVEQAMFERRNEFDLVVYYDQATPSADFLNKHTRTAQEDTLKCLYDSLYEFNEDKPLQRPPILLMGGLDAWADLLGTGALKTSNTTAIVSDQQNGKAGRPIRRVPVASNGSKFYLQKKRLRDYNPLEPEEEKKWLEKARGERPERPPAAEEDEEEIVDEEVPYFRTTEEFMRRFPEASAIEPQSMMPPARQPPSRPAPLPNYPLPSVPTIPSRPPPAASRPSYNGVHDRNYPAHHAVTARTSQLPSYFPPSQLPQNVRLPRTGLINFGVTCYMNATIQCLNATLMMTRYFRDNSFTKCIQRQNWRGSRGLMSENYATLIQNMWQENKGPCRPKTLRELCARINKEWGLDRQQDAKEFFDFLIDMLHEDLNISWAHPPAQALTEEEEARRERLPKPYAAHIEWRRWSMREKSPISELFGGQHASRLRCTTCHFTSTTFETFYSISVEIPHLHSGTLNDCLRSYCAEEKLSGDEVWRCPRCKKEREATKQIKLTRAPHYLVIHFKRFSASHTERARKVRTPIDFPLQNLDITPFMLPSLTPAEEEYLVTQRGAAQDVKSLKKDDKMVPPYRYNAYAVMRHQGNTLTSGHYIAMVRDKARGCWWQFNDSRVSEFQPERLPPAESLQNEMAYIVFYEREQRY